MQGWNRVCQMDGIPEGRALEVLVDGDVVAIFRQDGQLHAIDGVCAHQGGPLALGKVTAGCVTCPWHGWQYELASGKNPATGKPMLRVFSVREQDGWIELYRES